MPLPPDEVFDRGLQHERTALAWDRTGLSMVVAGAVLLRTLSEQTPMLLTIAGATIVAMGTALVFVAYLRYGRLHALLRAEGGITSPGLVAAVGSATVVFGIVAIVRVVGW